MIALLGDDRGHRSHQELNALRPQLADLGVETEWVPTDSGFEIALAGAPVHPLVRAFVEVVNG